MPDREKPKVASDVPATIFGLAAAAVTFFPPDALWARLAVVALFILLSLIFLYLKKRETAVQDAASESLQRSIDDLVRDLRGREEEILHLQRVNQNRPLIVIEYDCHFEETPEKPFLIRNDGTLPGLNITITPVVFENLRATFEEIPNIAPGESTEVLPDLEHEGLLFRHRIRDLLDKAWHKTRWLPALKLTKPEIERLFDQPVSFPITVTYFDPTGHRYTAEFELVHIYFAARAFVRLRTPEARAA